MDAKKNLIVDAVALLIYLIAANPALTGITVHEWLGLGLVVVFFVHAVVHVDWIAETLRASVRHLSWASAGNLALDALILIVFLVVSVSGILISGAMLPALGLYADGYYFWDPLHAIAAKILLALLLVHVVVHGKWLVRAFRKGKGKGDGNE